MHFPAARKQITPHKSKNRASHITRHNSNLFVPLERKRLIEQDIRRLECGGISSGSFNSRRPIRIVMDKALSAMTKKLIGTVSKGTRSEHIESRTMMKPVFAFSTVVKERIEGNRRHDHTVVCCHSLNSGQMQGRR